MQLEKYLHELIDKLHGWVSALILKLPNIVGAILLLIAFWILARLTVRVLRRILARVSSSRSTNELIEVLSYIAIVAVGVFMALGVLGLDKTVSSLLAGVGIIGLAVGLAFQSTGENLVTGLYLSIREPFSIGQLIESNGIFGVVEKIALRATWVRVPTGQLVLIPNKSVFANAVTNYSDRTQRRVDLSVGVSYGEDLEQVRRVASAAVEDIAQRDKTRPVEVFYEGFGDSSINFELRFWIDFRQQIDYLVARSEAVIRIKQAFDAEGITIPFPIRTLDFSTVGGRTLGQTLTETGLAAREPRSS